MADKAVPLIERGTEVATEPQFHELNLGVAGTEADIHTKTDETVYHSAIEQKALATLLNFKAQHTYGATQELAFNFASNSGMLDIEKDRAAEFPSVTAGMRYGVVNDN